MFKPVSAPIQRWLNRWLFRLHGVETGEVFLSQRRVFIVPTRAGLIFGVMLVILFLAAVNYNLSLGFALTFLIAGCAVIDMHLTFRNLAHLYLRAGRATPVFAGELAQVELHLANRRRHARYAIWLDFIDSDAASVPQAVDIAALTSSSVALSLPTMQRGWLAAPRVRLQTRFPLGLLRAWSYWQPDARVLVYPQPELQAPPLPLAGSVKADGNSGAGHDDFSGIRAYQSGDSIRHLAWRQIARIDAEGGALVTKQFEGGSAGELSIDFDALPRSMPLEFKLARLTRWVLDADAQGLAYQFRLGAIDWPSTTGAAHRAACLQALALYDIA